MFPLGKKAFFCRFYVVSERLNSDKEGFRGIPKAALQEEWCKKNQTDFEGALDWALSVRYAHRFRVYFDKTPSNYVAISRALTSATKSRAACDRHTQLLVPPLVHSFDCTHEYFYKEKTESSPHVFYFAVLLLPLKIPETSAREKPPCS